jgi:peptidyl-prolyl cis-trans isomerase B (cyclophilin B)
MKKGTFLLTIIYLIFAGFTMAFSQTPAAQPERKIDPQAHHPKYVITVMEEGKLLGKIVLELYPELAPKHCHNFDSLVAVKFYDGIAFHRVIPNFMIQGGDPNSKDKPKSTWGQGDPSLTRVPAEFSKVSHQRGMLSAARTPDPNSASTQFFICVANCKQLDGQYTVYGKAIEGMDVVDKIVNSPRDNGDNPLKKITMEIRKVEEKN